MSLADVTSARSSPTPACPECDTTASVTSDLHKYQVACTCTPGSAQYACADDPGPPPAAKTDTPPALPPRPPASVLAQSSARNNASVGCNGQDASCRRRKYAWWCVGCGALAAALGGLLAAQHILVRAYTASPHHLETVPAAVPAAMLVLTGVCIMSLARRRNRYSYMIKVVGACCLMCALTCVLVTITTTVIHMNKLQTLKFCEYTKLTRTCTCFSMPPDSHHDNDDEGVRCVFEGVSGCGVVHGALYWCLRGVFALSVSAVLVCIFSCMLAYQLLSHERKKMYWEQLELRCRSLYRPPSGQPTPSGARAGQAACGCCQCHPQPAWDISLQHRFWAPGRIGNLYSPNPGTGRKTSAWSWFPWPRSNSQNSRCRMGVPQSGDSAYGFCDTDAAPNNAGTYDERGYSHAHQQGQFQNQANFTPALGNFQGQAFQSQSNFAQTGNFSQTGNFGPGYQEGFAESSGSFDAQTGVWGPPPPYSPQGRGGSRHHLHHQDPAAATLLHHHHIDVHRTMPHEHTQHTNMQPHTCTRNSYLHHNAGNPEMMRGNSEMLRGNSEMLRGNSEMLRGNSEMLMGNSEMVRGNPEMLRNSEMRASDIRSQEMIRANPELARVNQELLRANPEMTRMSQEIVRANPELGQMSRLNPEMTRLNPEMVRLNPEMARLNPEMARLNEMGHMMQFSNEEMEMAHIQDGRFNTLRGHLVPYRCQRIGMSANNLHRDCRMDESVAIECIHQKSGSKVSDQSSDSCPKQGKENLGFQNDKHSPIRASMAECRGVPQNAESEVYFADVSSCCNVSVKAECCMNPNVSALVGTIENHPESTSESDTGSFTLTRSQRPQPQVGSKRRPRQEKHKNQEKMRQNMLPNSSLRLTEHQIEQLNLRMSERNDLRMSERNDLRMSERNDLRMAERNDLRMERNDSRDRLDRNDSRDRLNESRDRLNERNDSRDRLEGINESRICDRMNETRLSERLNDSRFERMNDSRISERLNDSRIERLNDSRISDRLNESRISERLNESRICDRMNETRMSDRLNDSRINRLNESDRLNESRLSDRNERVIERIDLNSSIKEGSPKMRSHISPLRMPRSSPKNLPKEHPRQSSSESCKVDFFVPPPPIISPLSPNTEESLLSDDDRPQDQVYSNDPEAKCLGPDSQYEPVREEKVEVLKGNHHHCYSDTNTMDSGWQSGSEKQVTD